VNPPGPPVAPGRGGRRVLLAAAVAVTLLAPAGAAPAAPSIAQAAAERVTLNPTTGVPGTVVQVTGTGLDPGASLRLRWDRGLGEVTVTAGLAGTFQAALLIFRNDLIGPRRLVIEPAGAGEPPAESPTTTGPLAESPTTTPPAADVDENAPTFLVLQARQSPAVVGPAGQGGTP
jgi:hypothetical protein